MISRNVIKQVITLPRGVRLLRTSSVCQEGSSDRLSPTHDSRTSPRNKSTPDHPGYTSADTPVSSAHPSTMPKPSATAQVSSDNTQASTRSSPPHQGIAEMAKGAETGGSNAVTPEERNVKGWGPNSKSAEFNPTEGKRKPVLDGGSNEGGFDSKGNSKT
ncbi:hypothetical protein CBS101457_002808 [Exobasidium rhododendri]|nr:hypothetical protein CBS101457_002808 [Exobasidium rhododendri]